MIRAFSHRCRGYLLAETLLALTIALTVVGGISGVVIHSTENLGRISRRLQAERVLTAAQITVLTLVREDASLEETAQAVAARYPALEVSVRSGTLVLESGPAGSLEILFSPGLTGGSW